MIVIRKIFFVIIITYMFSCSGNLANQERKYLQHDSYKEFLGYLKHNIDTIDSDFEKITYIRIKTAELIDRTFIGNIKDVDNVDKNWTSWNGERYYSIFYSDSATVKCGGSALFLNQVYNDLGYNSTTYNMGIKGAYTHQITLVQPENSPYYYVQDPFYNITFEHAISKEPLPFNELIEILDKEEDSLILTVKGDYEYEPTWDTTGISKFERINPEVKEIFDTLSSIEIYDIMESAVKQLNVYEKHFLSKGYPDNILYFYLFPLEHNSQEVNAIVQQQTAVMSR